MHSLLMRVKHTHFILQQQQGFGNVSIFGNKGVGKIRREEERSDSWGKKKACELNSGWPTKRGCPLMWSYKVCCGMHSYFPRRHGRQWSQLCPLPHHSWLNTRDKKWCLVINPPCEGVRFQKEVFQMLTCISGQNGNVEVWGSQRWLDHEMSLSEMWRGPEIRDIMTPGWTRSLRQ